MVTVADMKGGERKLGGYRKGRRGDHSHEENAYTKPTTEERRIKRRTRAKEQRAVRETGRGGRDPLEVGRQRERERESRGALQGDCDQSPVTCF